MRFAVKMPEGDYCYCSSPEVLVTASDAVGFHEALAQMEQLQADGFTIAGWLSYEAASAVDPRLPVLGDQTFPLLTMLASRRVERVSLPQLAAVTAPVLKPRIDQPAYETRCQRLLDYILAGDVYQANYSFRCDLEGISEPFELFCQLEAEHPMPHSAYIETDSWQVISQSPELFLKREGEQLISEPMKGTAPRRLTYYADEQERLALAADIKNRAENIMIVDLMRNDLGRVCEIGSIRVPFKFEAQRFHSLHQLVSRVTGTQRQGTSLLEILQATYPAGSITGAPKVRAMEIIADLELDGRKAYTGSVGIFLPGGDFSLNVAIRTLTCQSKLAKAELGIGSGVVANSERHLEWQECLLKGEFVAYRQQHHEVFETMLWQGEYIWLNDHLKRLEQSCLYWLIPFNRAQIVSRLNEAESEYGSTPQRVRLAVRRDGTVHLVTTKMRQSGWGDKPLKLCLSDQPIDAASPYQYHKTDVRNHYDTAYQKALANGFDEVLFLNQNGELAEGAISSVFLQQQKQWCTPSIASGILPGIWRAKSIRKLNGKELSLSIENLKQAEKVLIGNSLRFEGKVGQIWFNDELVWQEPVNASR